MFRLGKAWQSKPQNQQPFWSGQERSCWRVTAATVFTYQTYERAKHLDRTL
jgi:hypothetical protein